MYKPILVLFCLVFVAGLTAFDISQSYFSASYQGADVKLDWQIADEGGVSSYEVYRKKASETAYQKLTTVSINGSGNYTFLDDNLYKTDDQAQTISYKLVIHTNSSAYNLFANIQHSPTAVQRSWGSIKSMFK
ncbi:hypothetical protein SAMN05421780_101283 [Flexibacter flexilis DSM 6793]|uniref:Uncharacterized protein n=1 Tax=Flexibacter flexilis DSM 6793 TaxID=927664 RepID=A0A1I1DKH9_9BACT|nr:hypothetical protein [Flexibacter flexilis]SFB75367.1 hypothetical protein SAMN05421780_101283 [Flexibacter flexilis DSM 6793]